MAATIAHGMCRCCASEGSYKDFRSVYHWMGEQEVYGDMLQECLDITLSTSENGNNGGICELCITQLRNASNFKKQVLRTEQQFLQMVRDNALKLDVDVKLEHEHKDIFDSQDSDHDVTEEFCAAVEFEAPPIKEEEEIEESDGPKTRKRAAKASTSKAKKAKKEAGETSTKRSQRKENVEIKIERIDEDGTFLIAVEKSRKSRVLLNKHISNLTEILLCSNATLIRGYQGIGYSCCFCLLHFIEPAELKLHNLEEHRDFSKCEYLKKKDIGKFNVKLDITGLKCTLCNTDIDTLEQIIHHLANDHQRNIDLGINNQIFPFKFDSKLLRCCVCLNPFNRFKSLIEHMHIHYRNFVCQICNAGYVNQSKLNSHSYIHKLGEFECEFCPKVFNTKMKKINHEKGVHTRTNERAKCGHCLEKFKSKRKKEEHLAAVHGILTDFIKCQACDKTFPNADRMRIHTKRDHLMERAHQCPECDKRFFTPQSLKDHLVKHSGSKEFQCHVCLKAYARKKTLKEHLRIHADDRRFKCDQCGHAFIQKCSWKSHMLRKHGQLFN